MNWELGALKMLAKNQTVPGVALQDAISEIEKLRKKVDAYQKTLPALRDAGDAMADLLEVKGFDSSNSEAVLAWRKAQGK